MKIEIFKLQFKKKENATGLKGKYYLTLLSTIKYIHPLRYNYSFSLARNNPNSEISPQTKIYIAGALLLPVIFISKLQKNCAKPPKITVLIL